MKDTEFENNVRVLYKTKPVIEMTDQEILDKFNVNFQTPPSKSISLLRGHLLLKEKNNILN